MLWSEHTRGWLLSHKQHGGPAKAARNALNRVREEVLTAIGMGVGEMVRVDCKKVDVKGAAE